MVKPGKPRREKIQLVNAFGTDHIMRQSYVVLFIVGIPANDKILRVICRNADAFHSGVQLFFGCRHIKPCTARCTRFTVNQNCKSFVH